MIKHVPNVLTCLRLCLVPLTIYALLDGQMLIAFGLFVAAGLTDAVDGALARALDARTELGARLDPLADKALLVACYVTLSYMGLLPVWLVVLVVLRDVFILGTALSYYLWGELKVKPLRISKINTLLQIVLAATIMGSLGFDIKTFGVYAFGVSSIAVIQFLIWAVALTTLLSGIFYFCGAAKKAKHHMAKPNTAKHHTD